jgi:hypothetical protein
MCIDKMIMNYKFWKDGFVKDVNKNNIKVIFVDK